MRNRKLTLSTVALLVFTVHATIFQDSAQPLKSGLAPSVRLKKRRASGTMPAGAESSVGHTYGAFWEVGNGYSSTLYLRNKSAQTQVNANVVLFSNDGGTLQQTPLLVAAGSVASLALADIIPPVNDSIAWGGLMIEFPNAPADTAMGEVVIENYQTGVIFDLPLLGGYRYDTQQALYAPWWLPDPATDGTMTLFNITSQSIMVTPAITTQFGEKSGEPFALAPRETLQMSLRGLMSELNVTDVSEGSLTFRYTGPAHALDPALMLVNPSNGFSLTPAFNARLQGPGAGETNWQFPAVFLAGQSEFGFSANQNLTAYALISNGTGTALSPQFSAYATGSEGGAHAVALPIAPLAPLETRLVNLSALAGSGVLPRGVTNFALSVGQNGIPGSLAVTVFSVDQAGNFVFPSEGTVHPSTTMDSTYWDISGDLVALLTVYNPGSADVQATPTLAYQSPDGVGSYTLPSISLPANTTQVENLKQIVTSGVPDANGHVIPAGVTLGTLTLQTNGGSNGGLVVGGCTTFDPVRGGYGITTEPDCEICEDETDDCEVCEIDADGDSVCVPSCGDPDCCGSGPSVTIDFDGSGIPLAAGGTPPAGSPPYVNSVTMEAEGEPAGSDATYSWSTTSSNISLSNITSDSFSSTVTVTGVKASTANSITVNYTVGGQSVSQTISVTVQKPSSMGSPDVTYNGICNTCASGTAGWEKDITWTVMDQTGNPIYFALPTYDTLTFQTPNTCFTPTAGIGTKPGKSTNSQGQWPHQYALCSSACLNGGSCTASGTQSYFVNGFQINVPYTMTCKSIKVSGD
jgi:hypothetical protein